jgi:endonuclease/exonuclease/phosphatase family metal-dependent hydrolase
MASLRVMTWNCRSGSSVRRLAELAEYDPHVVFLQECGPVHEPDSPHVVCSRALNAHKSIALIVPAASCRSVARPVVEGGGRAAIAAQVVQPALFTILGIWARGPDYVADVIRTLRANEPLIRDGPAIVIGDFNSGSNLDPRRASATRRHHHLLDLCAELDLVSAYHAFHQVDPGNEPDATYFHQFKRSRRWHIDLCFVPRSWVPSLVNVAVVDGRKWARRSDHRPLLVEVGLT